ncbi:MAG: class I SAM-dependent methyltransferase [Defluviitaleaceae bacterium]|nr:class I SAM-dependent methyltransferase [Defluviitaleaceae bacterium]
MDAYTRFAHVYDALIDAPYEMWANHIERLWKRFDAKPTLVLDLACGTGNMSAILSTRGYDMIGVDISEDMLGVAKQKSPHILFLNQDMREFELYGTVDAIICICDSINYILEDEELVDVFKLVKNYLNPNGLFVFDINTLHKYKNVLADNNFSDVDEKSAYIWENFYDELECINEYQATFFIEDENGKYARHEEVHTQRAYSFEEIEEALKQAGLTYLGKFDEPFEDDEDLKPPKKESERVFFVAKAVK